MNIAINLEHFQNAAVWKEKRTLIEAAKALSDAGFKHFDTVAPDEKSAYDLREYMAQNSLSVIQSHMPMNRYAREDVAVFKEKIMQTAKIAKILDSKILVAHADEFDFKGEIFTDKRAKEFNYELFYDMVDFAEKNNMKVAFETVFHDSFTRVRYTSAIDELCDFVDGYKSDKIGICWDTGHSHMQYGEKDVEALKIAGKRVIATHIHDNYYSKDLHLCPFLGEINWKATMEILKAQNYQGDLTFEFVYDHIPNAIFNDYMKLVYKTGEYLRDLA